MPKATLKALADHGKIEQSMCAGQAAYERSVLTKNSSLCTLRAGSPLGARMSQMPGNVLLTKSDANIYTAGQRPTRDNLKRISIGSIV